ncbi:MAG: hypothetical protein RJA81_1277 [Planctomycetota bacterium]
MAVNQSAVGALCRHVDQLTVKSDFGEFSGLSGSQQPVWEEASDDIGSHIRALTCQDANTGSHLTGVHTIVGVLSTADSRDDLPFELIFADYDRPAGRHRRSPDLRPPC